VLFYANNNRQHDHHEHDRKYKQINGNHPLQRAPAPPATGVLERISSLYTRNGRLVPSCSVCWSSAAAQDFIQLDAPQIASASCSELPAQLQAHQIEVAPR
jgi:hypothetical protein